MVCSSTLSCRAVDRRSPAYLLHRRSMYRNPVNPAFMDSIYSYGCYTESWIEVSSRPSSSSLSSAATDDVIPPGFRVQHDVRRRRRLNRAVSMPYGAQVRSASTAGSSQEEYEESESESDRIMTSSNEGLEQQPSEDVSPAAPLSSASEQEVEDEDDDDENSTALGVVSQGTAFTPQPNAFSHPPQTQPIRPTETRESYFPTPHEPRRPAAHSYPSRRTRSHTPYNVISPSHQADHDAALRASLSTLLSCAAAARGLPKRDQAPPLPRRPTPPSNRVEPATLRMVPESIALGKPTEHTRASARKRSPSTSSVQSGNEKGKRKASTSKDRREARKKHRPSIDEMNVSPTLMTWVVSAGVVVLFSAISFSAGYAIGREVGRLETGAHGAGQGVVSGKDMGKGLRRLRWGSSSTVIRV